MKAKIIYSDKFLDRVGIFMKIGGITLWPFIILREKYQSSTSYWRAKREKIINHESIHIAQQGELLVIPFYVLYILEWFIKLFFYGKRAYYNISFEREAYGYEHSKDYLQTRKPYAWLKYIFNE
jgi:hypothetical protein